MTRFPLPQIGALLIVLSISPLSHAQDRLTGTGGVSSISGAGGGGLIPWASLGSLATRERHGMTAFVTRTEVDDFSLDVKGASVTLRDRLELSFAQRRFTITAADADIRQDVQGLKLKVAGDLVYGTLPQIAVGAERSHLRDPATARAVGAKEDDSSDYYLSAARVWINGLAHRTTLLNLNLRVSSANQFGILGYGGDDADTRLQWEAATAVFVSRTLAIGAEFRQKPDNLTALKEDAAKDLFVAWFPNKHLSVTAAWVSLGDIAGARNQRGVYLSVQGTF